MLECRGEVQAAVHNLFCAHLLRSVNRPVIARGPICMSVSQVDQNVQIRNWTRMCKSTISLLSTSVTLYLDLRSHLLYVENQLSVAEPVWCACDILGVQKFKQQWFKMIQSSFNKTRSKQHVLLFALTLSTESKGRTSFLIGNWMCWMCIFHVYFHVKSRSTSKQLFLK